ncbi:MAG: carotenoid biosynthesis protein, partial [Candidatus Dormiibacterota bacterium]
ALVSRWYAFGPWLLVILLIWRQFGWRRALPVAVGGWAITFAAEWASTSGPGIPFGSYSYRSAGLSQDWRVLGVPVFDSLSFTWLAFCAYLLARRCGARGPRRLLLAALAMVAIDVVVDPVALRGAHWWLGSIYWYPAHTGVWYGVSALNYLGWLVVALALQLWLAFWLSDRPHSESSLVTAVAAVLLAGVLLQSAVLAIGLGIGFSELLAVFLLLALALLARGTASPAVRGQSPGLLIACALAAESRAVRGALGRGWAAQSHGRQLRWSRRGDAEVEIWEIGLGLAAATDASVRVPQASTILVAGFAGACSPGWEVGEVAIGSQVLDPEGVWRDLDAVSYDHLTAVRAGRPARLASSRLAVDSATERKALSQGGVDLVDMETSAWADGHAGSRRRLAALRVVTDTPQAPLGAAATLVEPGSSGPSPLRVAQLLVRHPGALTTMVKLGRGQRIAVVALTRAVALAVPVLMEVDGIDQEPAAPLGSRPAT